MQKMPNMQERMMIWKKTPQEEKNNAWIMMEITYHVYGLDFLE
jgi:hypothetical protein